MLKYYFSAPALKELEKLSPEIQKRILKKLDHYCSLADPLKLANNLTDYRLGSYRYRIGEYRVIFDISKDKLIILKLGHRREIYK